MESSQKPESSRRFKKRWILWLLFLGFFIAPPTLEMLKMKWAISGAVAHAKTIRLEHFRSLMDRGGRKEIATKDLNPADFAKIEEAFPICPDIGIPIGTLKCVFNPHHRIVITDEKGDVTTIEVCFECDHVAIRSGDQEYGKIRRTPLLWMSTLRQFFAGEGMPNSPELYRLTPEDAATSVPAINK